ncbi:hypothetical protein [Agromyces bauzanensis]
MSDAELEYLRERAARGDEAAAARLVDLAGDRSDSFDLQVLAESGITDAMDGDVRLAAEDGDLDGMRRLAASGDQDAAEALDDLHAEDPMDDGT